MKVVHTMLPFINIREMPLLLVQRVEGTNSVLADWKLLLNIFMVLLHNDHIEVAPNAFYGDNCA